MSAKITSFQQCEQPPIRRVLQDPFQLARQEKLDSIVEDLKAGKVRLDLHRFTLVLLHDVRIAEIDIENRLLSSRARWEELLDKLADVLQRMNRSRLKSLPSELSGLVSKERLALAVRDYRSRLATESIYDGSLRANWRSCAEALMKEDLADQNFLETRDRPWNRLIPVLIGNCTTPGLDDAAVRQWVARSYEKANPYAAELSKLNRDGQLLKDLLEEMRYTFPQEAEAWFSGLRVVLPDDQRGEYGLVEMGPTTDKQLPESSTAVENGSGPINLSNDFSDLVGYAKGKLKKKQKRIILLLCEKGGEIPITEIGPQMQWNNPPHDWSCISRTLNRKLRRDGVPYLLRQFDGKARIERKPLSDQGRQFLTLSKPSKEP